MKQKQKFFSPQIGLAALVGFFVLALMLFMLLTNRADNSLGYGDSNRAQELYL